MKTLFKILFIIPFYACSQKDEGNSKEIQTPKSIELTETHKLNIIGKTNFPGYSDPVEIIIQNDSLSGCGSCTLDLLDEKINPEFMLKIHTMIFEYYKKSYADYKNGWTLSGEPEDLEEFLPDPNKISDIRPFLTATTIWIPNDELCETGFFGIEFECTWDIEHACGIRIKNWEPEKAGLAFDAYCDY